MAVRKKRKGCGVGNRGSGGRGPGIGEGESESRGSKAERGISGGRKGDELTGGERILVEEGAEGRVEVGELVFEGAGAFKKGLYAYGPEFGVAGGGVGIEEGGLAGLHAFEYGAGHR